MRFLSIFIFAICPLPAQIVLSEIMFDLEGTDSPNEFVEIYNLSSAETIDLSRWKISDRFSLDDLVDAGKGFLLSPYTFAIIMEGDYDIASGLYSSLIPGSVLILKVDDSSIGNGLSVTDSLYLIDESGDTVDSHGWENVSAPGFSLERIRLDLPSTADNWTTSTDSLGTPGFLNSMTPPKIDVTISSFSIHHSPLYPSPNEPVSLFITVKNLGTEVAGGDLIVFEDQETLGNSIFENLSYRDSVIITVVLPPLSSGIHRLIVAVDVVEDANPENDLAEYELIVRFTDRVLTINEFHYAPDPDIPEFIEFVNLSENSLDLTSWRFSDSDTGATRVIPDYTVPPGGYFVLTEDSTVLWVLEPHDNILYSEDGFPSLNNSGDAIYLFDPTGTVNDSLVYTSDWSGGNGRSVEKLNPELDSPTKSNWGTCVAPEKMTPGIENSIFLESLPSSGSITIEPNPFSPDGNGHEDILYISYNLPFSQSYLTILIFDSMGRMVRTLIKNLATGSHGILTWDGLTDHDRRARIGIYILKVSVVEATKQGNMEWIKTVVLAEPLR